MDVPLRDKEVEEDFFEEQDIKPDVKPEPEDLFHALYGDLPPSEDLSDVFPAPGVGRIEEPFVDQLPLIDFDDLQMELCDVKECSVVLERINTDEQDEELAQVMRTMSIQDLPPNEVTIHNPSINPVKESQEIVKENLPDSPDIPHPTETGVLQGQAKSQEMAVHEISSITTVAEDDQEPRECSTPTRGNASKESSFSSGLPSTPQAMENHQVPDEIVVRNGNMDHVSHAPALSSDLDLPRTRMGAKRRKENEPTVLNAAVPPTKKNKTENLLVSEEDQREVESFRCPFCQKPFSFKGFLKRHITSKHETPSGEKPYKCLVCGWKCKWPDNIHPHTQAFHLPADQAYRAGNFVTLRSNCATCGHKHKGLASLMTHVQKRHPDLVDTVTSDIKKEIGD